MYHPAAYILGSTATSREGAIRDRILHRAETSKKLGLPTRLPFLKVFLCGQDIPEVAIKPEDAPQWKEGDLIRFPMEWSKAAIHTLKSLYQQGVFFRAGIIRFNQANVQNNLFTDPISEPNRRGFLIVRVNSAFLLGDLVLVNITRPAGADSKVLGTYQHPIHASRVLTEEPKERWDREILEHEVEHAKHHSLSHLIYSTDLQDRLYPKDFVISAPVAEYLALLGSFIACLSSIDFTTRISGKRVEVPWKDDDHTPHQQAANRFRNALLRSGMRQEDIETAIDFMISEQNSPEKIIYGAVEYEKMAEVAVREYRKTYEHLFGLPLDVIRGIVAETPLP